MSVLVNKSGQEAASQRTERIALILSLTILAAAVAYFGSVSDCALKARQQTHRRLPLAVATGEREGDDTAKPGRPGRAGPPRGCGTR